MLAGQKQVCCVDTGINRVPLRVKTQEMSKCHNKKTTFSHSPKMSSAWCVIVCLSHQNAIDCRWGEGKQKTAV